ncbi:MAG: FtsW/RodA/SpoVE family cell cycle protein, partial [Saprospiraceae bacterium]
MNVLIENIKDGIKGDRFLWTIIILLSLCSLLAVYSASISLTKYNSDNTVFFLLKHVPFIIGGLILAWFISNIDYTEFSKWAPFFLIVAVALLVWALFFGVNINQAKRWIQVPFLDISFQVSDFAKLALIAFVARSISAKQDHIKSFKTAFVPIMLPVLLICGLIAPSNFSTSAILFLCCIM